MEETLELLTFNLGTVGYREETLEGRKYLVVPTVMMTEGVHNGSQGPGYYPPEELAEAAELWNHKPIVNYHPTKNGVPCSASDPTVLENQRMGFLLNTRYDSKQRTEAWFDEEKTKTVDTRVYNAILKKQPLEVSTGLFVKKDPKEGVWNTEKYKFVARGHKPDHLAVLYDQTGACSIKDGAGLFAVNEASFGKIQSMLQAALGAKFGKPGRSWEGYVEEVYSDFCIFWTYADVASKLYKIGYTATDTAVELAGDPVEVKRVTRYQTVDGEIVGNSTAQFLTMNEVKIMDKQGKVNALISNAATAWEEADRPTLMGMDEATLDKMLKAPAPVQLPPNTTQTTGVVGNAQTTAAVVPPMPTFQQILANASQAEQEQWAEMQSALSAEKTRLVGTITANARNKFAKEYLAGLPLNQLRGIAELAGPPAPNPADPVANGMFLPGTQFFYGAQGTPGAVDFAANAKITEEPLPMLGTGPDDK